MKKILIIIAIIISIVSVNKSKAEGIIIPHESIRFRVIANSNTIDDQVIKNDITLYMEKYIKEILENTKTKEESLNKLLKNKENIDNYLKEYIKKNNLNIKYKINIGKNYFPEKEYKGVKYQSGLYDSLVIELGKSSGMNWWCVIYPPLCLIEEDTNNVEYTTLVEEVLSNYNM